MEDWTEKKKCILKYAEPYNFTDNVKILCVNYITEQVNRYPRYKPAPLAPFFALFLLQRWPIRLFNATDIKNVRRGARLELSCSEKADVSQ